MEQLIGQNLSVGSEGAIVNCVCVSLALSKQIQLERTSMMLQGLSRYDAISKITKSMHYDNLGKCNHLVFMGQPLQAATQVVKLTNFTE